MEFETKGLSTDKIRSEDLKETNRLLAAIRDITGVDFNDPDSYKGIIKKGLEARHPRIHTSDKLLTCFGRKSYRSISEITALNESETAEELSYWLKDSLKSAILRQEKDHLRSKGDSIDELTPDEAVIFDLRKDNGKPPLGSRVNIGQGSDNILTASILNKQGINEILVIDENYFSPERKQNLIYDVASGIMLVDAQARPTPAQNPAKHTRI